MLNSQYKNRKVLVMGLGVLGGGIATAKWFVKHGAKVTVTDLKTRKELTSSIKEIENYVKKVHPVRNLARAARARKASGRSISNGVKFVLGKHRVQDFKQNEIIVVNPAVPRESKYLTIAKKAGARLENEAGIFFQYCKNPIIGVTGTRGKTTTANWIHYFLKTKYPHSVLTGNSSKNPMLSVLDTLDGKSPVVVELSSWHLELLPQAGRAPRVAVITNIFHDHLNRYRGIEDYAQAKANIFKHQTKKDFLILNRENKWTRFFLPLKPKSRIFYFPPPPPKRADGGLAVKREEFENKYGAHNFLNFCAASLAVKQFGISEKRIKPLVRSLPVVRFREEIVYESGGLKIINDSTATSPDATIAALTRFHSPNLMLIAGGTDKNLDFKEWANVVKKYVKPENLYLLNGSATKKMIQELQEIHYFEKSKPQLFESLKDIIGIIRKNKPYTLYPIPYTLVFSPSSASFEKFKNEFDRGEKFNAYSKYLFNFRRKIYFSFLI